MKILVLGGTGAMGVPLVKLLSEENEVWVTSRSPRASSGNVHFVQGNALDCIFLSNILHQCHWDAVVDFMVRSRDNLRRILPEIKSQTNQYVFISSARVYAQSDDPITENTPRLLDVSTDEEFLSTQEYSLSKAREEDLLFESGSANYTIVRPSITYNDYRLQLGTWEKEEWLYRALHGRSIVFSEDLADKITTMTNGGDVARGIAAIIGKKEALGQVYHITSPVFLSWREVLSVYLEALEKVTGGGRVKTYWTKETTHRQFKEQKYRLKYCRLYNRRFDNTKIGAFIDVATFIKPEEGLKRAVENFVKNPKFSSIDWRIEGVNDRAAGERTPLAEIPTLAGRITYLAYRYDMKSLLLLKKLAIKIKRLFQ